MTSIFLAGGGGAADSEPLDAAFARRLPRAPRLWYVPVALSGSGRPCSSCLAWLRAALSPRGIGDITMATELPGPASGDLARFDAVYIGGGNTYSLLRDVRESGFGDALRAYASAGGVVYGGSAGAIILGADIGTCAHLGENRVGLSSTAGLDLLNGLSVWCHYRPGEYGGDDALIAAYAAHGGRGVVAITERGGLHAGVESLSVIGDAAAWFSGAGKSVAPVGTTITAA